MGIVKEYLLFSSEYSGSAGSGGAAQATCTFTPVSIPLLTHYNAVLKIDLKVNNTSYIDSARDSQLEIGSGAGPDSYEWAVNSPYRATTFITTSYATYYIPMRMLVIHGSDMDVTNIQRSRFYVYATGGTLTIYMREASIILYPKWADIRDYIDDELSGVQALWDFDSNVTDRIAGEVPNNGAPIYGADRFGITRAVTFDGGGGGVFYETAKANAYLNNVNDWTIGFWGKFDVDTGFIYSEGTPWVTFQVYLNGNTRMYVSAWHASVSGNWVTGSSDSGYVNIGGWSYYVISLEGGGVGSGTLHFWRDGVKYTDKAGSTQYNSGTDCYCFGDTIAAYGAGGAHQYLTGSLSEFYIKNVSCGSTFDALSHYMRGLRRRPYRFEPGVRV